MKGWLCASLFCFQKKSYLCGNKEFEDLKGRYVLSMKRNRLFARGKDGQATMGAHDGKMTEQMEG